MKKWIIVGTIVVSALVLTACGEGGTAMPSGGEDGFTEEYSQERMEEDEFEAMWEAEGQEEDYGLDLSMYDAHGEWSFDRMWVHKTEESWDAVKGYYAYIDRDGNLVGEWHEEKTNDNSFTPEVFNAHQLITLPWQMPGDFQGEYAAVLCGKHGSIAEIFYVEIIDSSGRTVGRFEPNFSVYSYNTDEAMLDDFARKLSEDEVVFWDRDRSEVSMAWMEDGKLCVLDIEGHIFSALAVQSKVNGYYPYLYSFDGNSDFGMIDESGNLVFQGKLDYEVTELIPSADGGVVSVYFIGADERKYVVDMDFDGNWLTEPELAEQ